MPFAAIPLPPSALPSTSSGGVSSLALRDSSVLSQSILEHAPLMCGNNRRYQGTEVVDLRLDVDYGPEDSTSVAGFCTTRGRTVHALNLDQRRTMAP